MFVKRGAYILYIYLIIDWVRVVSLRLCSKLTTHTNNDLCRYWFSSFVTRFILKRDNLGKGVIKKGHINRRFAPRSRTRCELVTLLVASLLAVAPDVNSSRYSSLRSSLPGSLQQYRLPFICSSIGFSSFVTRFILKRDNLGKGFVKRGGHIFNTFI